MSAVCTSGASSCSFAGFKALCFGFRGQQVPKARSLCLLSPRFAVGQSVSSWCSQGCQAIVDTGTFLLTVPQEYLESILEALGAQETSYGVSLGGLGVWILHGDQSPGPTELGWHLQDKGTAGVGQEDEGTPG